MSTTCTTLFWDFFKPVAESVDGINTVNRSGGDKMDRLLGNSRSEDIYPAAFLLRPKYHIEDNGAGLSTAWFDTTFYVICVGDPSDEYDEDLAFDQAEELATDLAVKLQGAHETNHLVVAAPEVKVFMEPVSMVTLEASYGYEVKLRIGLMVNSVIFGNN